MAVLGVRSPADATSSRLEVLRALGSPPAGASGWSTPASSPAFPRRAARTFEASPLRRDSLGASPPATPAPRPSTAGTTSVADVFARDLIERMDRVEARQREQARELDAERAWARSAVEGRTARIEDASGRLQTHAAAAMAQSQPVIIDNETLAMMSTVAAEAHDTPVARQLRSLRGAGPDGAM